MNWHAEPVPHFTLWEARCRDDCGLIILQVDLLVALDATRTEFGKPITVNSWGRCDHHNRAEGGKEDSYHKNGRAIDLAPEDITDLYELERIARKHFAFVKRYGTFIHCDIRGERPC